MAADMQAAISFAVDAHYGQVRKGSGLPYIVHPIEVTKRLSDWGVFDEDTLRAAVLHDVLEDCPRINEDDLSHFGERVVSIVKELTYDKLTEKQADYMAAFKTKSANALAIKVSDRLCNLDDFSITDSKYAPKYALKAKGFFEVVVASENKLATEFPHCWETIWYAAKMALLQISHIEGAVHPRWQRQ